VTSGGLAVHGVVPVGLRGRARGLVGEGPDDRAAVGGSVPVGGRQVRFRLLEVGEMAAAVSDAADPPGGAEARRVHERVVGKLLESRSVVPAPHDFRARDEEAVRGFLERARLPLREALEYLEGCWELRLSVLVPGAAGEDEPAAARTGGKGAPGEDEPGVEEQGGPGPGGADPGRDAVAAGPPREEAAALSRRIFRVLRHRARAARRLSPSGRAVFTGAFLLPRGEWIGFVEEVARRESRSRGVELDVTGPWAPYDFVRMTPAGPSAG
jgi:hypothetical protein